MIYIVFLICLNLLSLSFRLDEAKSASAHTKSDSTVHKLEKTRDSIMVTKSYKHQESNGMTTTIWNPDDFTAHNLTNVTRLSAYSINNYENQDMNEDSDSDDDTFKADKYEDEMQSLASRSIPQLPQISRGLSMLDDKSSVHEPMFHASLMKDESIRPSEQTLSLATVGVGNVSSFYPSPTNRVI